MTHACLTVAIPFDADRAGRVEEALKRMGNPPTRDLRERLDAAGIVHFMSAIVARDTGHDRCHLLLEISADGTPEQAARDVAEAMEEELRAVLEAAGAPLRGRPLASILLRDNLRLGYGWRRTTGLPVSGVPGMSARRIRAEAELAGAIGAMRDVLEAPGPPAEKLRAVRERLWADEGRWKWAFAAEPAPVLGKGRGKTLPRVLFAGGVALLRLLAPLLLAAPLLLWPLLGPWPALLVGVLLLPAALVAGAVLWLRRLEGRDRPDDSPPNAADLEKVLLQENRAAQNLLAGVSRMKPGRFRRLALRLALGVVAEVSRRTARPGFLDEIGVIHFARWVLLPGTDRLVFLSNFSNSWESYLEDFILKAPRGLTSIWSNTEGFPRTRLLFWEGAVDGARFRRWARRQQVPVRFWYSAYPELTMGRIRLNAAIRQGVAAARTEDDAADWLACFGGAPRPASALDKPEIPTLAFGGLKKLRHAHCLVLALPPDPGAGRTWLREIAPEVAFGETERDQDHAVALGLSADGLRRLGVASEDLATFPVAFQHGMASPARARVLGDTGRDAAGNWVWGRPGTADVFLALYHEGEEGLDAAVERFRGHAEACGLGVRHSQRLAPLPERRPGERELVFEPFGFADGLSQPILRDTPKARAAVAADHVVEAGELILGYPDNSGYLPPTPSVAASRDPDRLLPALAPDPVGVRPSFQGGGSEGQRELGRNGSYLVVRHLDQYPAKLHWYVRKQAKCLLADGRSPWDLPRDRLAELLKAKMVGRWRDGRSLVRHPHPGPANGRDAADNDFRFAREDPLGLHCPFGAHVRRANPRDAFDGGSTEPMAISNRHRILRVGRSYGVARARARGRRGLMFMCLNADIERQFEFIQRNWVLGRSFHDTADEVDPLVGHALGDPPRPGVFTIPTRQGPLQLRGLPDFVRVRGGGYFFLPGRQALRYLAEGTWTPAARPGAPVVASAAVGVPEAAPSSRCAGGGERPRAGRCPAVAQDAAAEEA